MLSNFKHYGFLFLDHRSGGVGHDNDGLAVVDFAVLVLGRSFYVIDVGFFLWLREFRNTLQCWGDDF